MSLASASLHAATDAPAHFQINKLAVLKIEFTFDIPIRLIEFLAPIFPSSSTIICPLRSSCSPSSTMLEPFRGYKSLTALHLNDITDLSAGNVKLPFSLQVLSLQQVNRSYRAADLQGLSLALGALMNLTELSLPSGIPFGHLQKLKRLRIKNIGMSEIVQLEKMSCPDLQMLSVTFPVFNPPGVFPNLNRFASLQRLSITNYRGTNRAMDGKVDRLGLRSLTLLNNTLPLALFRLSKLEELDLAPIAVQGIPFLYETDLGALATASQLTRLELAMPPSALMAIARAVDLAVLPRLEEVELVVAIDPNEHPQLPAGADLTAAVLAALSPARLRLLSLSGFQFTNALLHDISKFGELRSVMIILRDLELKFDSNSLRFASALKKLREFSVRRPTMKSSPSDLTTDGVLEIFSGLPELEVLMLVGFRSPFSADDLERPFFKRVYVHMK